MMAVVRKYEEYGRSSGLGNHFLEVENGKEKRKEQFIEAKTKEPSQLRKC
jgi:hypothetical protein